MKKPDIRTGAALTLIAATTAAGLGANALKNSTTDAPAPTPNTPALDVGSTPVSPDRSDIATQGGKRLWGGPEPEHEGLEPKDGKPVKDLWGGNPQNDLGPVRNRELQLEEQKRINEANEAGDYIASDVG